MRATVDFRAHMDGADYVLKKGDEFKGAAKAAQQLKAIGLLTEKAATKGKEAANDR